MNFRISLPVLLVGVLFSTALLSQDLTGYRYRPLEARGDVPQFIRTNLSELVESQHDDVKAVTNKKRVDQRTDDFLTRNTFLTANLMRSGLVLYNDSVSNYLNRIVDRLLANEPEIRDNIEVYCLKSAHVNALATDMGIIFVTLGLVAEVENEAQLAFILAHEITHARRKHVLNSFKFHTDRNKRGGYDRDDFDDMMSGDLNYSKELELVADGEGFDLYVKAGYNPEEALNTLDVLQFSTLPFADVEFNISDLRKYVDLPSELFPDSIHQIDLDGDLEDDASSTHPNLGTRRDSLLVHLDAPDTPKSGSKYLVSEKEFRMVRFLARMEVIRYLQTERLYQESFYECIALESIYGELPDLRVFKAKALYAISKYKSDDEYSEIRVSEEDAQGNIHACYSFFNTISAEALAVISARYLYDLCEDMPDRHFMRQLRDDLFVELRMKYKLTPQSFQIEIVETTPAAEPDDSDTAESTEMEEESEESTGDDSDEKASKLAKLRKEREAKRTKKTEVNGEVVTVSTTKYHMLAFKDLYDEPAFIAFWNSLDSLYEVRTRRENYMNAEDNESISSKSKKEKMERKKGLRADLGHIVLVDPFYIELDNDENLSFEKSAHGHAEIKSVVQDLNVHHGRNIDLVSTASMDDTDTEIFNRICLLQEWVGERMDHENTLLIPLNAEYVWDYPELYGTDCFVFGGLVSYQKASSGNGAAIAIGILLYPTLPLVLMHLMRPRRMMEMPLLAFNLRTGDCYVNHTVSYQQRNNDLGIYRVVHDALNQLTLAK